MRGGGAAQLRHWRGLAPAVISSAQADNTARCDPEFRSRRRLRVALIVSAVVHLSAVTVFKVVAYFPVQEVNYYQLRFVDTPSSSSAVAPEDTGVSGLSTSDLERWQRLPRIEPPRLIDTDYKLTLAGETPQAESLYQQVYGVEEEGPRGPLASIEAGLRNLQTTFGRLRSLHSSPAFSLHRCRGNASR